MTNQVIPDAAIEAAAEVLFVRSLDMSGAGSFKEDARAALEAAAPILRQEFFLWMNLRAVQDELAKPLFPLGKVEDKRRHGND